MYTLFKKVDVPLFLVNSKLEISPLKGETLSERDKCAFRFLVSQIKREENHKAGSLRCIDLVTGESITLKELVKKTETKKLDFLNPSHLQRIDRFRKAGLTEKQVAKELETNEKMLYRNYPRYKSVRTSSTGRLL